MSALLTSRNPLYSLDVWRDYSFLIPSTLIFLLYQLYRLTTRHHQHHQRHRHGLPRPIPNSYWATPLVLACEYPFTPLEPHCPKLDALLRSGVRTFIDLTEEGELVPYHSNQLPERCASLGIHFPSEVEYHRFPIRDRALPRSLELVCAILDTLHANAARNRISAVHCRGGVGRTGMVVGCWLVNCGVARDGAQALSIVADKWKEVEKRCRYPNSPETGPQCEFVSGYTTRGA